MTMPHPKIFLPERNGGLLRGVLAPVFKHPQKKPQMCFSVNWILQVNALDFASECTGFCN